jgi:hypothetical protein
MLVTCIRKLFLGGSHATCEQCASSGCYNRYRLNRETWGQKWLLGTGCGTCLVGRERHTLPLNAQPGIWLIVVPCRISAGSTPWIMTIRSRHRFARLCSDCRWR